MSATQTVTVACKHPGGLILNLDRYEKSDDKGNVRLIRGKQTITLRGWSRPINAADHTVGGYALTEVDADLWGNWFAVNADSPLIHDRTILPPHKDAAGKAKDHAAVPAMFAPIAENAPGITKLNMND